MAGVTVGGQQRADVLLEELDAFGRRLRYDRRHRQEAADKKGREQAVDRPCHVTLAGGWEGAAGQVLFQSTTSARRVSSEFRKSRRLTSHKPEALERDPRAGASRADSCRRSALLIN